MLQKAYKARSSQQWESCQHLLFARESRQGSAAKTPVIKLQLNRFGVKEILSLFLGSSSLGLAQRKR